MFESIGTILTATVTGIAALFAGLWARRVYKDLKDDRDRVQEAHDAIEAAGKRLEEVRKAELAPIDTKLRKDFESQP